MPAPSFADVLDDALARARDRAQRTVTWSAAAAREASDPFLYTRPLSAGAAWTRRYPRPAAPPPPPRRPVRRLTVDEQRALARLLALGATLTEAFTADELKREYRRLALRHHPDRRGAGPAEAIARAATTFAEVAAAYRCLRAAVEPRH